MSDFTMRVTLGKDLGRRVAERAALKREPELLQYFIDTIIEMQRVMMRDEKKLRYKKADIFRAVLNGIANSKNRDEADLLVVFTDNLSRFGKRIGEDIHLPEYDPEAGLDEKSGPDGLSNIERAKRFSKLKAKMDAEKINLRAAAQTARDMNQFLWPFHRRLWLRVRSQGIYGIRAISEEAHIDAATAILGDR